MSEQQRQVGAGALAAVTVDRKDVEFAAVFEAHRHAVYNVAFNATRDREVATDLTQGVFATAFEHWAELRDRTRVRAWLLISAANSARMHFRDTRATEPMDVLVDRPAPGPLLEEAVVAQEAADLVWEAAGSLEPHHRMALDLRLRQGLSSGEVGDALGMPARKASDLLDRANEALRTAVRALLVRRQGRDCPGLTLLLADAAPEFTQAQRRTVDRHMRKCPACRRLADRLTRPAELFGGLLLLPVPAGLERFDPSWLHRTRPSGPPPALRATSRLMGRAALRSMATTPLALGAAATIGMLGIAGGVVATVRHGWSAPAAPLAAAPAAAVTTPSAPAAGPVLPKATAASASPPARTLAPPPPDESTKSVDAIWADTLTDIRASSSYHIVYSTTAAYGDTTGFDMVFTPSGYAGTITLTTTPSTPFEVRRVAGVTYVRGPSVRAQPDAFGVTAGRGAQLGDAWLALATTGPQADVATLVDRAVAPFASTDSLATGIASPTGRTHSGGVTTLGAQALIVLVDETGSMYVTDSLQPYPVRIVGDYDTVQLSEFNAVAPVIAPTPVQRIPSS